MNTLFVFASKTCCIHSSSLRIFIYPPPPPPLPPSLPPSLQQDSVCILLLQFSSLLVENAYAHIHDSNNKKQGAKLRRLMTFAWPCLLPKQCVVSLPINAHSTNS